MIDYSERPTSERQLSAMRFKFMPTPSAPLHVGHAWLLLVMDALAAKASEHGHDAGIVLVIDRLMAAGIQGLDETKMTSHADSIIQDVHRLGVRLKEVAFNDREAQGIERCRRDPGMCDATAALPGCMLPPHYFSLCSPSYFVGNAILDVAMGITHIVRGADQFHNFGIYRNVYSLLGLTPPMLMYLPLLLNSDLNKISSGCGLLLSELLQRMSSDELFCRLVGCCVKRAEDAAPLSNRQDAAALLLGNEWSFVLDPVGSENTAARGAFLNRLLAKPVVRL